MLSEKSKAEIQKLRSEYPDPQSALVGALSLAQEEYGGWLPAEALQQVRSSLTVSGSRTLTP